MLFETKSLTDEIVFKSISEKIDKLGIKLYYFLKSVEEKHMSSK